MKRLTHIVDILLILFVIICLNGGSLSELVFYGSTNGSLIESTAAGSEDEMRYLGKIREAAEGRWLMGNPVLKEHRDEGFSPSGFVDWIPAALLKALDMNMGLMLLITDLLFSAITIILTWAWLKRVIPNPMIVWCAMLILFFSPLGGSLEGLLRDTVPKFVQPLASLYLLMLTFSTRATLKQTLLRGILIGCMFYTYPYHWSLFIVTEGVILLYKIWKRTPHFQLSTFNFQLFKFITKHTTAFLFPFVVLAAPLAFAMHSMLSRPDLSDFYERYHIVYTHIPAAPRLQLIILIVLLTPALSIWFLKKQRSTLIEDYLPLLLPLLGMMILLNANIITGKDPELLGHGGRVIIPVVIALYGAVIAHVLPQKILNVGASLLVIFLIGLTTHKTILHAQTLHSDALLWNTSPEKQVLTWLNENLEPEQIISAPRILSEKIPIYTTHYTSFGVGAHFTFVSLDELTDRYLGWVGLYPWEKELTETATVIIFGNHPGAQWSKERTLARLLKQPFEKTMADYIPRQDLRKQIDEAHALPDNGLTRERLKTYNVDVIVLRSNTPPDAPILDGYTKQETVGQYEIWTR